jgi:hypothetical protein
LNTGIFLAIAQQRSHNGVQPMNHGAKMTKYFLIAMIAVAAAGCRSTCHDNTCARPIDGPAMNRPAHATPNAMPRPEQSASATLLYFKEARQHLLEARTYGFISNEEFANLTEKLQSDMRLILIAEAESRAPRPPRREDR